MSDYLITKLEGYKEALNNAGISAVDTMDIDETPGLLVNFEGMQSVFVTFVEGNEFEPEIIRISVQTTGAKENAFPEDIRYNHMLLSTSEVDSIEKLKKYTALFLSGKTLKVYPVAELVTGEEESEGEVSLVPRINALTESFLMAGAEDAQAGIGKIPFSIVADDDIAFVAAFERLSDDEQLLHFRTDLAYTEEDRKDIEEFVDSFNESSLFTKCSLDNDDLGLFGDEEDLVVTFHACTLDNGAMKRESFYGFFASLFEYEVRQFMDEYLGVEEEE